MIGCVGRSGAQQETLNADRRAMVPAAVLYE